MNMLSTTNPTSGQVVLDLAETQPLELAALFAEDAR